MAETTDKQIRRLQLIGAAAIVIGGLVAIGGAVAAHFTGLPETDSLGRDLYPSIPRGWLPVVIAQIISITGTFVFLGGLCLAFVYKRPLTWARASIGAFVFVGVAIILFGIVPNEWLTLTQSVWEWTPQKIAFTIPSWLVLNNDISVSLAALKDVVSGTYAIVVLGGMAVGMYQWQEYQKRAASGPPAQPVSSYGRPLSKVER